MFHRTDFGGFLVCCYKAIQQLNGVEKNSVAISLMLNHNLTGLKAIHGGLCRNRQIKIIRYFREKRMQRKNVLKEKGRLIR